MSTSLKLSPVDVERTMTDKPHLKKYADRLLAMDKDGNGELDLGEICEVLDEMATVEKEKKMLKWMAIVSGIFALLSIASIVGLTYAVVDLSKDTQVNDGGSVMVSKNSGAPVATGQAVTSTALDTIYMWSPEELNSLTTIVVPDEEGINVMHVSKMYIVPNTSITVTTADGTAYLIDAEGIGPVGGVDSGNGTTGGRRLLAPYIPPKTTKKPVAIVNNVAPIPKSSLEASISALTYEGQKAENQAPQSNTAENVPAQFIPPNMTPCEIAAASVSSCQNACLAGDTACRVGCNNLYRC